MSKKLMMMAAAAAVAFGAWAEEWTDPDTGYTWTYQINGDTAEIGGVSPANGTVTIPSTLGGKPVTSIGSYAFSYCRDLTSVTIPDSVTSIGSYAFYNCSGLTSVTIPNSVTSIGDWAFSGCSGLASVSIGSGVTSIGGGAFYGCSGLTSVTVPNSVADIGWEAFAWCEGLKSISVDSGNAHYKSVNGLLLSKDGKTLLQGVNGNVTIPASVTSIEESAFSGCGGLTSVTIPDSVTDIGWGAFSYCGGLKSISVSSGNANYKTVNGLLLSKDAKTLLQGVNGNVTIPSSVTSIGYEAFLGCSGLTSVTIPDNVTSIGAWAFAWCSGLTSVTIPNSVTSIGAWALENCSGLTRVAFQGDCPEVWDDGEGDVYWRTDNVTTYVSRYASGWDAALAAGEWMEQPIAYLELEKDIPPIDYTANPDGSVSAARWAGARDAEEVYVPARVDGKAVTAISRRAFASCAGLKSVVIPASVTWLADEAFAGCSALVSVTYLGDAPDAGRNIYQGTPRALVSYVRHGSVGWSGGLSEELPGTWMGRDIAYMPIPEARAAGTLDMAFGKAQTVTGALYDAKGNLVGTAEVKVGKISASRKTVRVSASATLLADGKAKRVTARAATVAFAGELGALKAKSPVTLAFKAPIGGMTFELDASGVFALDSAAYGMKAAAVGGNWTRTDAAFYLPSATISVTPFGSILWNLLPNGEPVIEKGGKWSFNKAASVKWTKPKKDAPLPEIYDEASGKGLIVDTSRGKTNLSGLKLSYTPKTGLFKGSFKTYALERGKLKTYTVNVVGFVVDGEGVGQASLKKPAVSWNVTVK